MNEIKANLDFKLDPKFLEVEARKMIGKIKEDAAEGIFQNGRGNMSYKSKQYVRYKANSMRRFTFGGKYENSGKYSFNKAGDVINTKKLVGNYSKLRMKDGKLQRQAGQKLKDYNGVSTNTNVAFVDMNLTGQTLKGMKGTALTNGFQISFDAKDSGKVLGNQKRGYDLVGLREDNKAIVAEDFKNQLMKQFKIKLNKPITITIGK